MSLSGWDKATLDGLAKSYKARGKEPAKKAYNKLALASGWHNTPMWIDGRTYFKECWVSYRKAHNESLVGQNGNKQ